MGTLFPLYLLGAAAIAVPIILHLTRQTSKERVSFSSTMFLDETAVPLKRRNKIEDLLLLILRCLALLLITLAFARPFFGGDEHNPAGQGEEQVAFLIDTSASMQRPGLWEDLQQKLQQQFDTALSPRDEVAVYTYAAELTPLVSFNEWPQQKGRGVIERLKQFSQFNGGTKTGDALVQLAERMNEHHAETKQPLPRRIVVLTDNQIGADLETLHAYEWADDIEVSVIPLEPSEPGNASIHLVRGVGDSDLSADQVTTWIRISNSADSGTDQFSLGWADMPNSTVSVYVPAGESRVIPAPKTPDGTLGTQLELRGDAARFDNQLFVAPQTDRQVNVLYLGEATANDPNTPYYFFHRALMDTRTFSPVITARRGNDTPTGLDASAIDFCLVTEPPENDMTALLLRYLERGGLVLYLVAKDDSGAALGKLSGDTISIEEATIADYALLSHLELGHPALRVFDDPEFGDFSGIHFWKHRAVQHRRGNVLAKFDGQAPAGIEWTVGPGKLMAFTSNWQRSESQFTVSSRFIPLLFSILEYAGTISSASTTPYAVHDAVAIPQGVTDVVFPDGRRSPLEKSQAAFTHTEQAGIYRFEGPTTTLAIAVNQPLAESRTDLAAVDHVVAALTQPPTVDPPSDDIAANETDHDRESRQRLWRWLILAVWGALIIETGMAAKQRATARLANEKA